MLSRIRTAQWLVICFLIASVAWGEGNSRASKTAAIQLNNLGVAYMNQQNFAKAEQLFTAASEKDPSLPVAQLNRGIALLNEQQISQAGVELRRIIERDPRNIVAWYNLGLAARKSGNSQEMIEDFKHVTQLDPNDADAHYLLGSGYDQRKDYEDAIAEFQQALRLNPLHASAEFGLARAHQQMGMLDAAKQDFARFQHITSEKLGSPMTITYGEMGRYSLAQTIHVAEPEVGPMIPVRFVREPIGAKWRAPAAASNTSGDEAGGGGCMMDIFGDGRTDLITLDDSAHAVHAYRNLGGDRFEEVPPSQTGLDLSGDAIACTVGDFDNDGLPDIAISLAHRVVLFRNLGHGKFSDVTKTVGITTKNQPAGLT
ncbi:MAG: tetratricopeptide repeat protein, partial [Acidobacteriaceae bacterium]